MTDIRRQAVLIVDGWRFHSTYDSSRSAHKVAMNIEINNLMSVPFTVKPFGVHISQIDPMTEEVTEWHKVEGSSIWYRQKRE